MTIQIREENGKRIMEVEGRVDTTTAPEFEKRLLEELALTGKLYVDMEKVVYVSSAGLRAFLNGQKYSNKNKKEMIIFHVGDMIMEVFEMTGFIDILTVE